jgi:hypothetical protein
LVSNKAIDFLTHPVLWSQMEGGFYASHEYERNGNYQKIKLLFISKLVFNLENHQKTSDERSLKISRILGFMLGSPPYKTTTFDRWWKLEELGSIQNSETLIESFPKNKAKLFAKTGYWIDDIIKDKEDK